MAATNAPADMALVVRDLADLGLLLAAYGACVGDPDYNSAADLDDNGCVELADLGVLLANYGVGT